MEGEKEDPNNLNIRCPSCRLRFSVAPELMNRIVECGGCDSQFRITDEVIIHSKKIYPGEKKEPDLHQFRRIPSSSIAPPVGMQTINYAEFNHPEQLGPSSPLRVIAGVFGVSIMVIGALLLLISSNPSSPMGGMTFEKKIIIGGFTSLLGFIFLVYANPRTKIKAGVIGVMLAAGIFSIPFFLKETPSELNKDLDKPAEITPVSNEGQVADPIQTLRERFLTQPLESEQKRLAASNSNKSAYGIFLTDMLGRNKLTARDYLIRETNASLASHPFPRNNNNHLMVLTEVEKSFDQVAVIASKLGKIAETYPEINVIVVKVDNEQFIAGSAEKLNDKNHPSFYELNRLELQSIDLGRIQQAVERLADSDATLSRSDITQILIGLLEKPNIDFHDSIARALLKWAEDPGPAAEVGLRALKSYVSKKTSPPEHLVRLVADYKNPEAIPTMVSIWETNPVIWDNELVKFGPPIEALVREKLSSDKPPLRRATIKMLGEIGTAKILPELRKILSEEDPEVRLLAQRAIQQIEQR